MAKRSILVSDMSGEEVTEENGANLRITRPNSDEAFVLDLTWEEAEKLFTNKQGEFIGRKQGKRGRKPGTNGEATESK